MKAMGFDFVLGLIIVAVCALPVCTYLRRLRGECARLRGELRACEARLREERRRAREDYAEWQSATGLMFPFLASGRSELLGVQSPASPPRRRLH